MERDEIVNGEAISRVEGVEPAECKALDDAFEAYRTAINEAWRVGNVRNMRAAVEAYDRFAEVVARSN